MNRNEKPLTLDELRIMNGKTVWVDIIKKEFSKLCDLKSQFGIVRMEEDRVHLFNGRSVYLTSYGSWTAYSAETPRINREAWQPCQYCGDYEALPEHIVDGENVGKVFDACICEDQNGWHIELPHDPDIGIQYCPVCGRPLTNAAWKQLEERLM